MKEDFPIGGSSFCHHAGSPLAQPYAVAGTPAFETDSLTVSLSLEERALDHGRIGDRAELVSAQYRCPRAVGDFQPDGAPRRALRCRHEIADLTYLEAVSAH